MSGTGSGDNDPNAWLGLLKWSLAHQDGTAPSDARPMSDEDREWLEKVVSEGVRDDMKVMTEIYGRLCDYLDDLASSTTPAAQPPTARANAGEQPQSTPAEVSGSTADNVLQPPPPPATALSGAAGMLSTYVAPPPATAASAVVGEGAGRGGGGVEGVGGGERLEGIMNDLEELQDMVEQIDMAETFAKIGGFGRLIALAAPACRPDQLRRRAASVMATLTKNNPPAQALFSSSGGQRALLEALSTPTNSSLAESGESSEPSPPPSSQPAPSLAVRLSFLHTLSCSVMGDAAAEAALCSEARFQQFLGEALRQGSSQGGEGVQENDHVAGDTAARLRSKAAFVLKALVGAPGALRSRVEPLWPAILALLEALEASLEAGPGDDPAAARETCIEALLAAARSAGGARVVDELGPRVSVIMARRRQILLAGAAQTTSTPPLSEGDDEADQESAAVELDLWMQWERLTPPSQ